MLKFGQQKKQILNSNLKFSNDADVPKLFSMNCLFFSFSQSCAHTMSILLKIIELEST